MILISSKLARKAAWTIFFQPLVVHQLKPLTHSEGEGMLGPATAAQPAANRPTPVSVLNNFTWPNPAERFTFEADADDTSLCASL